MRVLFFNYEYPPLGGGAGNATFFLLKEFAKLPDLEVDLVTSSFDDKMHVQDLGGGVTVYQIPIGKTGKEFELHHQTKKDLIRYAHRAFWFSRKLLRRNKYDLTHSFFTVPCGALSRYFWFSRKLPYIVSLRGADVPGYSERFDNMYAKLLPMIKNIWKNSAQVVSNSAGLKELAAENFPAEKIAIIPNGVDTEEFQPRPESRPAGKFIITPGASRLTERKGLNYLIEAVKLIEKECPQVELKIMGDGNAKEQLEAQVKELALEERVEFIGRVPREKTTAYYQEASVFVLLSLNEGMSNALLEAISCGLPVITTNTGGTAELVKDGVNGFVVEKQNPEQVAACIKKFKNNRSLLQAMGKESRAKAEQMSWQNVARQYHELYRKVGQVKEGK